MIYLKTKGKICKNKDPLDCNNLLENTLHKCTALNSLLSFKLCYIALKSNKYYEASCRKLIGCLML